MRARQNGPCHRRYVDAVDSSRVMCRRNRKVSAYGGWVTRSWAGTRAVVSKLAMTNEDWEDVRLDA